MVASLSKEPSPYEAYDEFTNFPALTFQRLMEVTSGGLSSVVEVSTALHYGVVILPFSSCVSRYSCSLMDACSKFLDIAAEF